MALYPTPAVDPSEHRHGLETVVEQIRERARNLYLSRQFLCAEAVVVTLNNGLDGGLTEAQAVAVSAPFCIAMGESGCLCGALSGAVLGTGLFLADGRPHRHRSAMRDSARQLHDAFKRANGATCCRVLTKHLRNDPAAHFRQCAELTAMAAELAARLILTQRPGLMNRAGSPYLSQRQSVVGGVWRRLVRRWAS